MAGNAARLDPEGPNGPNREIPVWDLPVRLFHWALALCLIGSIVTAQIEALDLHGRFGVAILILLLFRILWGIVGGEHARFASFVRGPAAVLRYLREMRAGTLNKSPGHNPLGGWSVLAMLLVLGVQAGLGLFATDDVFFEGPLAHLVSNETSRTMTSLHHLNANLVVGLVALHVAAALAYLLLFRMNLIRPMITGRMALPRDQAPARSAHPLLALLLLAASGAAVFWLVYGV